MPAHAQFSSACLRPRLTQSERAYSAQGRFDDKWASAVLPKMAEDEAACRTDEASLRRRIAEVRVAPCMAVTPRLGGCGSLQNLAATPAAVLLLSSQSCDGQHAADSCQAEARGTGAC